MKTKIWTALITIYIVWGSTYLAIRFAVETIPPFMMAGTRFLIAGIILFLWRRAAGDPMPTKQQWISTAIVGVALLMGANGTVSWAEQRVPSGISALMVSTIPLWLVLFEALRPHGAKPGWRGIVGLLVGFGGVFLLIGPSELSGQSANQFDTLGLIALLFAALIWALGSIYSRHAKMPKSSLMGTAAEMLAGATALLIVSAGSGEFSGFHFASVSMRSWFGIGYLIAIGSLVGFVSYGWLLQNAPISLVSTYPYVNPVIAVFLGSIFANEALTPRILLAAAIIIGSVVFINSGHKTTTIVETHKEAEEAISVK